MVSTASNDDLLNDLLQHPGIKVLEERLVARKAEDANTLALAILNATGPIDQQRVDEKRGFWRGADWFLKEARRGARAFERESEDGERE